MDCECNFDHVNHRIESAFNIPFGQENKNKQTNKQQQQQQQQNLAGKEGGRLTYF